MEGKPLIQNEGIDDLEVSGRNHNQITPQTEFSSDRVSSFEQEVGNNGSHDQRYNNLNSDCDTVVIISNTNTASTSLSSQTSLGEAMSAVRLLNFIQNH